MPTTQTASAATLPAPAMALDISALTAADLAARKAVAVLYLAAAHGGLPRQSDVSRFQVAA